MRKQIEPGIKRGAGERSIVRSDREKMAGEAIEIAALRTNLRSITSAVQGNLQWFADGLIEKAFIAPGSASGILETHGVTPAEKAGKLLNSVFTKIETSKEKRRWFNEFLAIFSDKVYEELVKTLTENGTCYYI